MSKITLEETVIDPSRTEANPQKVARQAINDNFDELFAGLRSVAEVTATADGLTTGIIPDTAGFANVTSASANDIVTLPTPTPGRVVIVHVGANGCELRSSAPATVAINGGTGASAESALAANVTAIMYCVSPTAWKGLQQTSAGVLTLVEAAA